MNSYITFADVLEHLFRYGRVEQKYLKLLKPSHRSLLENIINAGLEKQMLIVDNDSIHLVKRLEFLLMLEEMNIVNTSMLVNYIDWNEFEEYIASKFRALGLEYVAGYKHSRVAQFQIDVLAIDNVKRIGYVVECKHWRRAIGSTTIAKIVAEHIKRIDKFINHCEWIASEVPGIRKVKVFIPMIVTLYTAKTWFFDGVPIVSIRYLNDFLSNIDVYIDALNVKRFANRCYVG